VAKAGGKLTIGGPPRRFLKMELREQERQERQQRELRQLLQQMRLQQMLEHSQAKRPTPPVRKLSGKEWIRVALDRRRAELLAMTITEAGDKLSKESETAPDCAKPLSVGHCINLLRDLNVWSKKPRKSPRQRPK
jgi:hypothetical protein